MSRVLIAAITQLCHADHDDDPAAIAARTTNKSEAGLRQMLGAPGVALYVAERDGAVVGAGGLRGDTNTLNYVDPAHRNSGVGRALLAALESNLRARKIGIARLESTMTARSFYLAQGWVEDETAPGLAMWKALT